MSNEKKVVNRTDLAVMMKEKYGISLKESKQSIEMVIDAILSALKDENNSSVALIGFGTFEKKLIAERKGRDFRSGEEITIPEHTRVIFRTGSHLKRATK